MTRPNPMKPEILPIYSQYRPMYYYIVSNVYVCDYCGAITKTLGPRVNLSATHISTGEVMSLPVETVVSRLKLQFYLTQEQAIERLPEMPLQVRHADPTHHPMCHECLPVHYGNDVLNKMPLVPNMATASGGNFSNISGVPVKNKTSKKIKITQADRERRAIVGSSLQTIAELLK